MSNTDLSIDYSKNVIVRDDLIARGGTHTLAETLMQEALAQSGIGIAFGDVSDHGKNVMHRLVQMAHRAGYKQGATEALAAPIDMILHCPACGMQHIDAPEETDPATWTAENYGNWTNPPHRSHKCQGCGHIWRPADVDTNGVQEIKTKGKDDSPECDPGLLQALSAVGRDMVNLTTTVQGREEWPVIPELWRQCVEERDQLRAGKRTTLWKPTEQQILHAAETAGLWPNTVRHWMPAFDRFFDALQLSAPPRKEEQ
jgi:hypothetical protein